MSIVDLTLMSRVDPKCSPLRTDLLMMFGLSAWTRHAVPVFIYDRSRRLENPDRKRNCLLCVCVCVCGMWNLFYLPPHDVSSWCCPSAGNTRVQSVSGRGTIHTLYYISLWNSRPHWPSWRKSGTTKGTETTGKGNWSSSWLCVIECVCTETGTLENGHETSQEQENKSVKDDDTSVKVEKRIESLGWNKRGKIHVFYKAKVTWEAHWTRCVNKLFFDHVEKPNVWITHLGSYLCRVYLRRTFHYSFCPHLNR